MYYANVSDNKFVLPGRLRIFISELRGNHTYSMRINQHIIEAEGIQKVFANHYTGNVLVMYDDKRISVAQIEQLIMDALRKPLDRQIDNSLIKVETELRDKIVKAGVCAAVLIGIMTKQLIWGKSPLARHYGLYSLAAVTTIATGLPTLKSGLDQLTNRGRINCNLIFSLISFTCIVLRESTLGLFIITMVYVSEAIETFINKESQNILQSLLSYGREKAKKILDQQELDVSFEDIVAGDIIRLYPGAFIPVDGEVIQGEGTLSHAAITGESSHQVVEKGNKVYSGGIVEDGIMEIRALSDGKTSERSRILRLIDKAWQEKLEIESTVDQYYQRAFPYVIGAAAIHLAFTKDIFAFISILLVGCPKPAYHAAPIALRTALLNASKKGIYIKNPSTIEKMGKTNLIMFDKTGTLTTGMPRVSDILEIGENSKEWILSVAASGEQHNQHPIARALKHELQQKGLALSKIKDPKYTIGRGISCVLEGENVIVGNKEWMLENDVRITDYRAKEKRLKNSKQTPIYVVYGDKVIGLIGVQDKIKTNASSAVERIQDLGISNIEIISGDTAELTRQTAEKLGIPTYHGSMLPESKIRRIRTKQNVGKIVTMIGDGINDCPALKCADVGITLSGDYGNYAVECADVFITNGNLNSIPSVLDLSQMTMKNIYGNYRISLGLNLLGVLLALTNSIGPFGASLFKDIHGLIILINAMRPGNYDIKFLDGQVN